MHFTKRAAFAARIVTLLLSGIAVLYGVAWLFLGMIFPATGTVWGVTLYLVGFALAATPMVAHRLAGLAVIGEAPLRRTALWGLLVMTPAGFFWGMVFTEYTTTSRGPVVMELLFMGVPAILSVTVLALFAVMAVGAPSADQ